ncbi:MAG TPA: histone deacetylase family protein [Spirochaetota bacterium]|nr:histone deacetylase family protein [Spirochaetota bacterium]HPR49802.1 histone deacetylase family protein [Spirochaetota bacterium]
MIYDEFAPLYEIIKPEPCSDEDILRCHSEGLLLCEKNDPGRYEISRLAAGGAIKAAELSLEGFLPFAVIRPPGHHANPDHNWGFCFFNNMGIALMKLLSTNQINRAVVLDIDLHFGDGTDAIFKNNEAVSVYNIQSSNRDDFIKTTENTLAGAGPSDVIGISAGFDQYIKDWGANLTTEDYETIGEIAGAFSRKHCGGKIFIILEGGYYLPDLGVNAHSLLKGVHKALS